MDSYTLIPDNEIKSDGKLSNQFKKIGINRFSQAIEFVHNVTYGYNSNYQDPFILFKEKKGSCTSKHATIAGLAEELHVPLYKTIGIYRMTEDLVEGTNKILQTYGLPYIPMIHCFLVYKRYRFDLSEGNLNGKKHSIEDFIRTKQVAPLFSQNDEYIWYKEVLEKIILSSLEMQGIKEITILKARQMAITLLKSKVSME